MSVGRLERRREMLRGLVEQSVLKQALPAAEMDGYQQRAFDLLTSSATARALRIADEPAAVRSRYGRHAYGQSVLLARRLVEAGVRFVTVYYSAGIGGWDTHAQNFKTLRDSRLPQTDSAVSSLLEDLQERGLLEKTLVFWTGDFGRTPKINGQAGRDHWPPCQTVLLAGGGVAGGRVIGRSDKSAAYPAEDPHRPDDVMATIYHALGVDPHELIRDQLGRPMPLADGHVIGRLFS
jgi:uncharacterized protein (DUF1501 family)